MSATASACTPAIQNIIATPASFATWKSTTAASLATSPPPRDVSGIEQSVFSVTNCLQEKINILKNMSTTDAEAQTKITAIEQKIETEKKNVQVSTDRVAYARNPVASVSYYQSWFPIDRPLKPLMMPILIGISVFVSMASFAYLLACANIFLLVEYKSNGTFLRDMGLEPYVTFLATQFTISFWIVLAVTIGLIIYITKK
jgi:hypothetical protein